MAAVPNLKVIIASMQNACAIFLSMACPVLYKTFIKPILCYGSITWTLTQTLFKGKYCKEYMAQHTRGDAGVPDEIINSTAYTMSQTLWWRTSKLED
jgi:hypothetical protein